MTCVVPVAPPVSPTIDPLPFFFVEIFLLQISPSLFHDSIGPIAVSLPSASPAHSSVAAASATTGIDFCTCFPLHMVDKFVSFLSISGCSPTSLTIEVMLISTATSLPSRRPSSSSPPLLAELPRLLALAASHCCTLPAAVAISSAKSSPSSPTSPLLTALTVALAVVPVTAALNLLSSDAVFPCRNPLRSISPPKEGYSLEQQECLGPRQRPPLAFGTPSSTPTFETSSSSPASGTYCCHVGQDPHSSLCHHCPTVPSSTIVVVSIMLLPDVISG
ncbi:hypothetical protein BHM03_00014649 [Ensete ventricosum]|nr:hypothetical protein BHM03_00014649 [Ensete ventricosum]